MQILFSCQLRSHVVLGPNGRCNFWCAGQDMKNQRGWRTKTPADSCSSLATWLHSPAWQWFNVTFNSSIFYLFIINIRHFISGSFLLRPSISALLLGRHTVGLAICIRFPVFGHGKLFKKLFSFQFQCLNFILESLRTAKCGDKSVRCSCDRFCLHFACEDSSSSSFSINYRSHVPARSFRWKQNWGSVAQRQFC